MRLYLAIAVLMLALVAYTEAQEETFKQQVAKITEQVTRAGQDFGEKISDFALNARAQFSELVNWMREKTQGN